MFFVLVSNGRNGLREPPKTENLSCPIFYFNYLKFNFLCDFRGAQLIPANVVYYVRRFQPQPSG